MTSKALPGSVPPDDSNAWTPGRPSTEPLIDSRRRSLYHASLWWVPVAPPCSSSRTCLRRASSSEYRRALTKSWSAIAVTILRMARSRCLVTSSRLRVAVVTNAEPASERLRSIGKIFPSHIMYAPFTMPENSVNRKAKGTDLLSAKRSPALCSKTETISSENCWRKSEG
jgi:hypothetical protein